MRGPLDDAHTVTKLPAQDLSARGAFFFDSEGNLLSIGQATR